MTKKLMLLGGLRYLIPVIETAHRLGIYVITVDYIPNNIAHQYSDEYHNVSIIDKEAVLELARRLKIDGIMSFAVDPGVVTAAYVAEKMGLPFQGSYKSVCILQDKAKFREFLKLHNFNIPEAKGYDNKESALLEAKTWNYPVIVKPVDSAGSKGVTKVNKVEDLSSAIETAISHSIKKEFIIEEFIEPLGCPSDSDCFTVDGNLQICTFSNQYFDSKAENPFTPAAFLMPSTMPSIYQKELKEELQRLMTLLNIKTGIFNIETRVGANGKTYLMEVSPRGGGNRLAELSDMAFETNLIENSVRNAVNLPLLPCIVTYPGDHYLEIILHSNKEGSFQDIIFPKELNNFLLKKDVWVNKDNNVASFNGANNSLGSIVFKFPTDKISHMEILNTINDVKVLVK